MTAISKIWIGTENWESLRTEASDRAPLETGGMLLGYWTENDDAVVTDVVGPGPNAVHLRDSFRPDQGYHERELARRYVAAECRLHYLGDWHTHPGGGAYLSERDLRTLRRIACSRHARSRRPVMAILFGEPPWRIAVWRYAHRRRWLCCDEELRPLALATYDDRTP